MVRLSCLSCFSWFPPRRNRTTKGTNHTNKRMARVPNLVGRSMGSNEQLKLPVYNGDPKPSILNHHDTYGSTFVSFVFFVVPTAQESNHERHEPHEKKERQTFLILWSFDGCEGSSLATWLRPRTKAILSKPPRYSWFDFRVFRVFRGSPRAGIKPRKAQIGRAHV